jgi:glycosyl transferase, family 25
MKNMPIYLVSLESDLNRRKTLELQFPKTYKDFIHIPAVDGRKLSAKEYYDKTINYYLNTKKTISPSELGCTLSHINVLESFLKTDAKFALIIEDDVIGSDNDINKISRLVDLLDDNSLFICGGQNGLTNRGYLFAKKISSTKLYLIAKFFHNRIFSTACYVVSKKTAKEILEYHKKILTLADRWGEFFKYTETNIYYLDILKHPEDLSNSHIEQDRNIMKETNILKKLFSCALPKLIYRKVKTLLVSLYYKKIGYSNLCSIEKANE